MLVPRSADGQLFARALEQQKRPVGAGYGQRRIDGGLQHVVHGSRRFQCAGHVQHRREPPQVSGAVRGLRHGGDFFEQRRRNAALAADGNLERIFDSEADAVPGAETDAPGLPAVDLQAVAAVAVFDEIDAVLEQDLRVGAGDAAVAQHQVALLQPADAERTAVNPHLGGFARRRLYREQQLFTGRGPGGCG